MEVMHLVQQVLVGRYFSRASMFYRSLLNFVDQWQQVPSLMGSGRLGVRTHLLVAVPVAEVGVVALDVADGLATGRDHVRHTQLRSSVDQGEEIYASNVALHHHPVSRRAAGMMSLQNRVQHLLRKHSDVLLDNEYWQREWVS